MADNIIKRGVNVLFTRLAREIAEHLSPETITEMERRQRYYEGAQPKQLRLKAGQADDNLVTNLVGLAVDRSNSMLLGGGVQFVHPNGSESAEQLYLNTVWDANKKEILLQRTGQDGEVFGTWYIEIVPDGIVYEDVSYPRLVLVKPSLMAIVTDDLDLEKVEKYIFTYKYDYDDEVITKITRRVMLHNEEEPYETVKMNDGVELPVPVGNWVVETYRTHGARTDLISAIPWLYDFPPIIHCQNMPSVHGVLGRDGLSGGLDVQDKYNLITSNLLKIIRYHAHPKTWGSGLPATNLEKTTWGADELIKISSENGKLQNLEMQSDLASSRAIQQDLRQTIFDLARVVDISSMKDKIGGLTNFGLRLLYSDAISKNSVRRLLYGDALEELNRRLLIMNEMSGENEVVWGSDLPADEKEDAALILNDLAAGLVSKETASTKRGYTWETSQDGQVLGEKDKLSGEAMNSGNTANNALLDLFAGRQTP